MNNSDTNQAQQLRENAVVGSALKLLDSNEIDPLRYFKID